MRIAVSLKKVVKYFEEIKAVDGISLEIKEGEIFGMLGPNGAGKTTTINMILGLLSPTSGVIAVNGIDVAQDNRAAKKVLGLMTQETVVERELTARENLELFAELYHVPKGQIPKRIENALQDAELVQFADKKAGTFSGGMQRRLELVKSMIQQPKILILDEPTIGLDVQNRVRMWERIRELRNKGVTIIMTTQYLEEADALCDRIAIIDHGKIKAMGTAEELKKIVGIGKVLEILMEGSDETQKAADILRDKFKLDVSITRNGKIIAGVDGNKTLLTEILKEFEKRKLVAVSVSLHLPTLDDVFIKLTGADLRDATGEARSSMALLWTRR